MSIIAYTAEPGSTSHDSLQLLAHWAATNNQTTQHQTPEPHTATSAVDNTELSCLKRSTRCLEITPSVKRQRPRP
jgi:hypothetical protein